MGTKRVQLAPRQIQLSAALTRSIAPCWTASPPAGLSKPTFSVGEYDWGAHDQQRGWIWNTSTTPQVAAADHLRKASNVFDFSSFFSLQAIDKGNYGALYGLGNGIGMVGDTTDGLPWRERSVTFVENDDTGYRTNDDGTPQSDHLQDTFANNWQVEQAYAQVLTHPGVPTVYWKHYFEWGDGLQTKIRSLINARKVAGVHAGSTLDLQSNARAAGVYAACVVARNGALYVRIGGSDDSWQPSLSGYADYREYAAGAGWKVWVGVARKPAGPASAPARSVRRAIEGVEAARPDRRSRRTPLPMTSVLRHHPFSIARSAQFSRDRDSRRCGPVRAGVTNRRVKDQLFRGVLPDYSETAWMPMEFTPSARPAA